MQGTSIAIIGAGVAGLATGCYAQMNGYTTSIFEQESRPGGVCTSWRRGDYVFDGCLQWLLGTRPSSSMNRVWRELGALDGRDIVNHDECLCIESRDGRALHLYTDADRLEQHLCELAPADAAMAHTLCETIRRCARLEFPPYKGEPLAATARLVALLPSLVRWSTRTWQELSAGFTDHFVRDALRSFGDMPDLPALGAIMPLAWMHARDAGYPIGGSLALAEAIAARYLELGGTITYGARIERILVEDGRAVGVRLRDGTVHRADYVISCADGHATIFELLEGRFVDDEIRGRYTPRAIYRPLVQVSLGVDADFSGQPRSVSFPVPTPLPIAGEVRERLTVTHYAFDPTMAPAGKTSLAVLLETDYDRWEALAWDPEAYAAEKGRVAEAVQAVLSRRFERLLDRIEQVDVATPMTWVRHTSNWRGSYEGWLPTRPAMAQSMLGGVRKTLPGLDGFYMVGQWVVPGGGLPGVAPAARSLIQRLCKQDRRPFVTTVAPSSQDQRTRVRMVA
jgi:phytoene dehydrogenase-like protein